jgi:hypothetical protein
LDSEAVHHIEQQPDLDAPSLDERDCLDDRPARGVLAREGLHEAGEERKEIGEDGPRHELGDAATARRVAVQRAPVEALDHPDAGIVEQRREQPGDEVGAEVADVGVDPAHDVAVADVQRLPHRVALPASGGKLGHQLGDRKDAGPFGAGGLVRRVGRAVVHDDDLVDEVEMLDEASAHGRDDASDGGLFVARRKADRHGVPVTCLGRDQRTEDSRLPRPPHGFRLRRPRKWL